jgi:hypothetical protein
MNIPLNTYCYKSFEGMTRDPALPEAAREIAEKNLAQTRETYDAPRSIGASSLVASRPKLRRCVSCQPSSQSRWLRR